MKSGNVDLAGAISVIWMKMVFFLKRQTESNCLAILVTDITIT